MRFETIRKLIVFNIILVTLFLSDYLLPGNVMPTQELDHFYVTTHRTYGRGGKFGGGSLIERNILLLTNGDTYRLGKIPEGEYVKGQKIQVVKSIFKNNITKVIILGDKMETKYVGVLSNKILFICFTLSVIITLLNIFYNHRILSIFLVASTFFIFLLTIGYFLS